ncbi:hypothetical protein [Albimonas pacifica]|uniref:Secreted protein n=1 Tax=Albimonas pacifica TaxID=1114924 RepID=A0A1I3INM4_9RHOB|nr:hypothetical protein [Albimonas pacifica]SFI49585.1 hypothetical protein SAMN05216258_107153 [Albimonas pacifica]
MKIAKTALTTTAAAAFAASFGIAPAFADAAGQAPAAQTQEVQTAGVAQQAQLSQAPVLGLPAVAAGAAVVAATFGLAIAASNSGGDNTPNTR